MICLNRTSAYGLCIIAACSTLLKTDVVSAFVVPTPVFVPSRIASSVDGGRSLKVDTALSMARRGRPRGPVRVIEQKPLMNEEIEATTLRVTTPNAKGKDEILGIMSKSEALDKAKELGGLDLILINANSDPPVCKIVDYSKYRYMKEKKAKELKKNSKATEIKEVKMSYKIDSHDYGVRAKHATKFLKQGNRVKVSIMFRGREIQHDQLGYELIDKLVDDLEKLAVREGKAKREGRTLTCILSPRPDVLKQINDEKRAVEKQKRKEKEASLKARDEKLKMKEAEKLAQVGGAAAAATAAATTVNGADDEPSETTMPAPSKEPDLSSALDDIDSTETSSNKPPPVETTLDDLASALDDLGMGDDSGDDDDDDDDDLSLASSLDDLLSGGDLTDDLFT